MSSKQLLVFNSFNDCISFLSLVDILKDVRQDIKTWMKFPIFTMY